MLELTGPSQATPEQAARGPRRVLLVDGDTVARAILSDLLIDHGYRVETARDATELETVHGRAPFDLIVLEAVLPGESGLSICRRLSRPGGPAIILFSALSDETERIIGLEIGADDYVSKDCSPREVLARIRAVLRRCDKSARDPAREPPRDVGLAGWRLDVDLRQVRSPQGSVVNLTAGEFALLQVFADRPMQALSRDRLRDLTSSDDRHACDRTIDMQVSRLRQKLRGCGGRHLIRTRRNEGYVFDARVHAPKEAQALEEPTGSCKRGHATTCLPDRTAHTRRRSDASGVFPIQE